MKAAAEKRVKILVNRLFELTIIAVPHRKLKTMINKRHARCSVKCSGRWSVKL